jgi:translocation and assembly module TamB
VYELALEAKLGSGPGITARGDLLERALRDLGGSSASNLIAALSLRENGNSVLFGAIGYPGTLSLHPFEVSTLEGEPLRAILQSQELPCEKFDPILPSDISLEGVCKIDFSAEGPADDPALDGRFDMRDFRVSVAGQAEALAQGAIELGGTAATPIVKGDITIENGLILVPENLQQLHPIEGDALLLSDRDTGATSEETTPSDSLTQTPRAPVGEDGDQVDIKIAIPSRFFVRGRGLDLELAGDLNILKTGDKPTVIGELRAIQGNFVFLGRSLKLERGTVTFLGEDEINPAFDVALSTRVGDTLIKIILAGTAQKPRVILHSEPDMQEGDIISVLLFGAPFNELSDGQAGHAQSRTTEMAAALGAAQLQKNLSGVDVVNFRGADDQDKGGTLQVGKYLSPNILLSYVYALEDQTGSFVSLEYFLKWNFKVDTVYGRRNQTGLGLGWAKDY